MAFLFAPFAPLLFTAVFPYSCVILCILSKTKIFTVLASNFGRDGL
jgi:hypothetical protein